MKGIEDMAKACGALCEWYGLDLSVFESNERMMREVRFDLVKALWL